MTRLNGSGGYPSGCRRSGTPEEEEVYMISLYQWLIERKGYTEDDASIAVDSWDIGIYLPPEVKKDIYEYSEEYIQKYPN